MPASGVISHAVVHPVLWPGDPWAHEIVADARASLARTWAATSGLGVATPTLGAAVVIPSVPASATGGGVERAILAWELDGPGHPQSSTRAIYLAAAGRTHQQACGWHSPAPLGGAIAVVITGNPRCNAAGTATHEIVESATDPGGPSGWHGWHALGRPALELADACLPVALAAHAGADVEILDPHTGRCVWLWRRTPWAAVRRR